MSAPSRWPGTPEGEEAFAELLARREDGETVDIDAFCAERPALAGELRELWRLWNDLAPELGDEPGEGIATPAPGAGERRYEVLDELGRGGMGVVYRVRDTQLGRTLAMKVIRAPVEGARRAPRRLSRFLEEARITGQLGHPGIVPIHELGVDARGQLYFTMPLVEGHTLEEIFELVRAGDPAWTRPRMLGVLLRACEAMAFAHDRGVVHRDLKPSNVMVGRFGETYVLDWGLARMLDAAERAEADVPEGVDPSELRTREGDVVGTPAYMPPEQAAGRRAELGTAADVYAIGATLYQLLTLHRPYDDGRPSTAAEVLARVKSGPPRRLASFRPAPPAELVAICEKAMARDPSARYADMSEVADDLRAFLEGRVVRAYEEGGWAEFKKWVGRNRALAAAVAAVFALALGGLGAVAWVQAQGKAAVLRLSDFQLLSEYEAEATELWPAYPERVGALEDWLARARALVARRPVHEARWSALQERAAGHPGGADAFFDDPQERWQAQKLAELVDGLGAFGRRDPPGTLARVEQRLATARAIRRRSIDEPAERWRVAIAAVAAPTSPYGGLVLAPQMALVPLGADPDTGLQEFAHLLSGAPPERTADGSLAIDESTGIVLVLLPGGRFELGADPSTDPFAVDLEGPVHAVELAPFFLAKYETTQAQWERVAGGDPSGNAGATPPSGLRPVENVAWLGAERELGHLGLALPTEAQWEYGARGGTREPWWTGADAAEVVRSETLDGYGTLPVGSGRPNPFGLFDVLGNVMEWCRDRYGEYDATDVGTDGEGLRAVAGPGPRVYRGGHCAAPAEEARAALRRYKAEGDRHVFIGVRAARRVE